MVTVPLNLIAFIVQLFKLLLLLLYMELVDLDDLARVDCFQAKPLRLHSTLPFDLLDLLLQTLTFLS